ncbi:hypothetical protein BDW22DRAFT_1354827, partial [Trametopsis cervina]
MTDANIADIVTQQVSQNYVQVVSATLFAFDWLLMLPHEVEYIWRSQWSFPKLLYLWARYPTIADTTLGLLSHFTHFKSTEACKLNNDINSFLLGVGVYASEWVLIWRTFALWQDSGWVKFLLAILWLGMAPIGLYLIAVFISSTVYAPQPLVGLPGCHLVKASSIIAGCFAILAIVEIVIVILTLVKAIETQRTFTNNPMRLPLTYTLYRDGLLFFMCLASLSVANVLAPLLGPKVDALLLPTFLRVMHANLSCRVILHIREAASEDKETMIGGTRAPQTTLRFASNRSRRAAASDEIITSSDEYIEGLSPVEAPSSPSSSAPREVFHV